MVVHKALSGGLAPRVLFRRVVLSHQHVVREAVAQRNGIVLLFQRGSHRKAHHSIWWAEPLHLLTLPLDIDPSEVCFAGLIHLPTLERPQRGLRLVQSSCEIGLEVEAIGSVGGAVVGKLMAFVNGALNECHHRPDDRVRHAHEGGARAELLEDVEQLGSGFGGTGAKGFKSG